jgi:hypothetical protein
MLPAMGPIPRPIMPGPIGHDPMPQHCDHGLGPCCCSCCALTAVAREIPAAITATSNQLLVDIDLFLSSRRGTATKTVKLLQIAGKVMKNHILRF